MPERADNSAKWIVRRTAKAALAGALCAAGARYLVRAMRRRQAGGNRVLILSYHRVTHDFTGEAERTLPSLLISGVMLRRQLDQLAREREIVSLADACRLLAEPPQRGARFRDVVAITFDDGYSACSDSALPLLLSMRVPASVFVATGYLGTERRLPHDRLYATLSQLAHRGIPPERAGLRPDLQGLLDASAERGPASTLDRLISRLPHDRLVAIATALELRLGMDERDLPPSTRLMTWDEVRALRAAGLDIGGHTVNHAVLCNIPFSRARAEVEGCRDDIAAHVGAPPRHFAYPNGYHTPAVRRLVAASGFKAALTTEDNENTRGGDPFRLRRKVLWENSTLGAVGYSRALAACSIDSVFFALGWVRPVGGERPDALEQPVESCEPEEPDEPSPRATSAPERAVV